jgi:hypothetical protein
MLAKVERWRDLLKYGLSDQVLSELPDVWPATTQVRELQPASTGRIAAELTCLAEMAVAGGPLTAVPAGKNGTANRK